VAKLIYYAISSLDGYIEDADGKFGWGLDQVGVDECALVL
jgi:hypothetical protein